MIFLDWLNAPEILIDVGLTLVATPTVDQPDGHTRPGEWYTMNIPAVGLLPSAEEIRDRRADPAGLQSAGGRTSHWASHWKRVGCDERAIATS